jgi:hypothetical protein
MHGILRDLMYYTKVVKAKETKKCRHRDDDDFVDFCQVVTNEDTYVMGCQLIRRRRQLGPLHKFSSFVL